MVKIELDDLSRAARELGRQGGLAVAAGMTPEQRRTRARKAVLTRYAKRRARANEEVADE